MFVILVTEGNSLDIVNITLNLILIVIRELVYRRSLPIYSLYQIHLQPVPKRLYTMF